MTQVVTIFKISLMTFLAVQRITSKPSDFLSILSDGMKLRLTLMTDLDEEFKRAFIKFVKELPELQRSMNELSRQLRLMPTSMRVRY